MLQSQRIISPALLVHTRRHTPDINSYLYRSAGVVYDHWSSAKKEAQEGAYGK